MIGIILAAGRGSRLGLITNNNHKALLKIKGKPLIEYQIDAFHEAGINKIYIVTGYNSHLFEPYNNRNIILLNNLNWKNSNMMISIMTASDQLKKSNSIISYSDIFYEPYAIKSLLDQKELTILYSSNWKQLWRKRFIQPIEDAETFSVDDFGYLIDIGAPLNCLDNTFGQYMGIMSFTPEIFCIFQKIFYNLSIEKRNKIDVTSFLRHILISKSLNIKTIEYQGLWGEVDRETDLDLYNSESFYLP